MVDFNVSNGLPGAEEFCMLVAGCLVRTTEGFRLLVAPVDEVLKQCETSYATYVLDWDWKLGLRDLIEDNSKQDEITFETRRNLPLCLFVPSIFENKIWFSSAQ